MAAPSVLTFEELTGQKRSLELNGAALPFQGAKWSGAQKIVTTWNPGNADDAVQHVLGPQELPTEWEGYWNTTRISRTPAVYTPSGGGPQNITRASTLADIVDDFRRIGALLRVTWSADDGRRKVRVGRIEQLDLSYVRMDDIRWSIHWAWKGTGVVVQNIVTFAKDDHNASQTQLNLALDNLQVAITTSSLLQAKTGLPNSATDLSLGGLEAMADGVTNLVGQIGSVATQVGSRISQLGDLINKVGSLPAHIVSQIQDIAATVHSDCVKFSDSVSRQLPEAYTAIGSDVRPSQVIKTAVYFHATQQAAEKAAGAALTLSVVASRTKNAFSETSKHNRAKVRDMLAVHLSKQGETFASISKRYYKTADLADRIAKANGFPLYQVAPPIGRPLIIPNRATIEDIKKV